MALVAQFLSQFRLVGWRIVQPLGIALSNHWLSFCPTVECRFVQQLGTAFSNSGALCFHFSRRMDVCRLSNWNAPVRERGAFSSIKVITFDISEPPSMQQRNVFHAVTCCYETISLILSLNALQSPPIRALLFSSKTAHHRVLRPLQFLNERPEIKSKQWQLIRRCARELPCTTHASLKRRAAAGRMGRILQVQQLEMLGRDARSRCEHGRSIPSQ